MPSNPSTGIVYLVGAGPGDPALLTLRGAELLASAEVVIYDYLSNPRLLEHCPKAEAIYVGKKAAAHSFTQEQINALLVEKGQAGKRVVRLKGGDPFVFGRGGEECEALAAAKIRFEVVPGVTAAIGAPAYAGIPVTHRDFNSSFTFITGHEKEEEYRDDAAKARDVAVGSSDVDWAVIAKLPCVAFYMGVKSLPRICAKFDRAWHVTPDACRDNPMGHDVAPTNRCRNIGGFTAKSGRREACSPSHHDRWKSRFVAAGDELV